MQTNPHIPTFILLPVDNNRTAYRPFGLPMILMETDRRDISGASIANSGVIVQNCDCGSCNCMGQALDNNGLPITKAQQEEQHNNPTTTLPKCNTFCNGAAVRIVIEEVPHRALVVGQIPVGLMSPDHEIFAKNISMNELTSRMIHPDMQTFWRIVSTNSQGAHQFASVAYEDVIPGDLMQYTTASGHTTDNSLLEINQATGAPYPRNVIPYYPTANYYDLSDITIENELLPPDWYNLAYQAEYYARVESNVTPGQLNCVDPTRKATSVSRFRLNHPGQVMEETVRMTPAPYMTDSRKSVDTTVGFYRPFTDILQDIFDEQYLLGSVNFVDWITPQYVPYLSYLLGLDLPYYPHSIERLRKTMLRNVARLQQLKGSRNAVYDMFELFGYIVHVNNLYWSTDGKRLIRPGEKLPEPYQDQEIKIEERCQIEPILVGYNTSGFGELTIPLLYRPTFTDETQGLVNARYGGEIVLNAYLVKKNTVGSGKVSTNQTTDLFGSQNTTLGYTKFLTDFVVGDTVIVSGETVRTITNIISDSHLIVSTAFQNITSNTTYTFISKTYKKLEEIACDIGTSAVNCPNDPGEAGSSPLVVSERLMPGDCHRESYITSCPPIGEVPTDGIYSYSRVIIDRSSDRANSEKDITSGEQPPFIYSGVRINRKANLLYLTFNGAIQFDDKYGQQGINAPDNELLLYAFATYSREELIVPNEIKNLYSNRFDIQLLTQQGQQIGGDVLEFLIDYLFKIKAFHSLLNVLIYHCDLNETYQVTSFCVGGDVEQRYDIDAGKLQVPPAIYPHVPVGNCYVDPIDLCYKPEDIALREIILTNLPEEFQAWVDVNRYLKKPATLKTDPICVERIVTQIGDEKLPPTPPANTNCAWGDMIDPCVDDVAYLNSPCCKFTYLGQDRLVPGNETEASNEVYDPTPFTNTQSWASQSTSDISPIHYGEHGSFYPTGPAESSNNDSSAYSAFAREYSVPKETFCKLNGTSDYCYKGRVDDELLRRMTLMSTEQYQATPCKLNFGDGIYYAFPATSELTNSLQGPALKQPYNESLVPANNSFLGRLLRAYDTVQGENVHFTNRPYLTDGVSGEKNLLALQRQGLNIQLPLMHFPGTRFATVNKLESDFTHPKWMAKPWDDQYSTSCGPYNQSCHQPTYLNAKLEEGTNGTQHLVYDSVPFTIIANHLQPDIPSFGSHLIGTDSRFSANDVVHSIYSTQSVGNPAITLESMSAPSKTTIADSIDYIKGGVKWVYGYVFDHMPVVTIGIELKGLVDNVYMLSAKIIAVSFTEVTIKVYKTTLENLVDIVFSECDDNDVVVHMKASASDGIINVLDKPLFSSASLCHATDPYYVDYIDGYPASYGYQPYILDDFDRSGTYTELFDELDIDRSVPTGTEMLFSFISGILYQNGYRVDCGCASLSCESGTSPTLRIDVLNCSLDNYLDGSLPFSFNGNTRYGYDYNPDRVITDVTLDAEEKIGVHDLAFDGQLVWDEDPQLGLFQRQMNMFELCTDFPTCVPCDQGSPIRGQCNVDDPVIYAV